MDFSKAFQFIPDTIVVLSPEYTVLAATDAYLAATLRTREDLIGQNFLQAFPDNPGSAASSNERLLRESLDRALVHKKVDFFEPRRYDIPKPEGGYDIRYWEATHTPVLDEAGEVQFIIQRTSDVTEREITKLALSETENKYQFMAEAMPQLIFTLNAEGRYTYFNQRWTQYTGLAIKEMLDSPEKVVHPEDHPGFMSKWEEAFRVGEEYQVELRIKDKDGDYRWHLNRTLPMRGENGQILMWVGSATDIHTSRLLVQELLESNEQMSLLSDQVQMAFQKAEAERQTYERLFMQAPAVFAILKGPSHEFTMVNPSYQQLFPNRQLLHRTVAEALPEVVDQGFISILDNVYQTGETFVAEEILIRLDRQDTGQLQEVYFNLFYQARQEGESITGIMVFGFEITKQVKMRLLLEQSS